MDKKRIYIILGVATFIILISIIALCASARLKKKLKPENERIKESKDIGKNANEKKKFNKENTMNKNNTTDKNNHDVIGEFDGIRNFKEYKILKLDIYFEQIHKATRLKMEENKEEYEKIKNKRFFEFETLENKIEPNIFQQKRQFEAFNDEFVKYHDGYRHQFSHAFVAPINNSDFVLKIYCDYRTPDLTKIHFCPYFAVIYGNSKGLMSVMYDNDNIILGFIHATNIPFSRDYKINIPETDEK